MAMPTDFWRNDQMLNIFRTKPCQRLGRDGVCGWRSQCQFSHNLEWPRRQPRRYNYSPEVCPNIRLVEGADGTESIENTCSAGLRCPWAHSKEEVLFHPLIFKTNLCEEHTSNAGANQKTRNAKKNRCHRYYCPFAHGSDELRTSTLSTEARERCLRAMEVFPSDVCCVACSRHWITPTVNEKVAKDPIAAPGLEAHGPSMLWGPQAPIGPHAFDVLSTVPNLFKGDFALKPSKEFVPSYFDMEPALSSLRVSSLSQDSPAFIDLATPAAQEFAGYPSLGPIKQPSPKFQPSTPSRDVLGEFYYAML